jgi:hypothetical protein
MISYQDCVSKPPEGTRPDNAGVRTYVSLVVELSSVYKDAQADHVDGCTIRKLRPILKAGDTGELYRGPERVSMHDHETGNQDLGKLTSIGS